MDARCSLHAHRNALVARTLSGHATPKVPLRYAYYRNPLAATSLRNKHRQIIARAQHLLPRFATEYAMLQCNFNGYVEQVGTRRNVLQRSHEVRDGRPIRGNCDAFADRRRRSGGSRAHRAAKEPPRSRPTCHRHPIAVRYPRPLRFAQWCVLKEGTQRTHMACSV